MPEDWDHLNKKYSGQPQPNQGNSQPPQENPQPPKQDRPSRVWYLLPILLGLIGGVIGYFVLRNRDRKFAERMLIIGVVMTVLWWVISFLLSLFAYAYIADTLGGDTVGSMTSGLVEVADASCGPGQVFVVVRNVGEASIDTGGLSVSIDDNPVSAYEITWSTNPILKDGSSVGTISSNLATSGRAHIVGVTSPGGRTQASTVSC